MRILDDVGADDRSRDLSPWIHRDLPVYCKEVTLHLGTRSQLDIEPGLIEVVTGLLACREVGTGREGCSGVPTKEVIVGSWTSI